VSERWVAKNTDDPIRHRPDLECAWIKANADRYPLSFDAKLAQMIERERAA
jgi:hypothetical protein